MPDFLSKTYNAELPTGGDLPAGFIGKWIAVVRWVFMTEESPSDFPEDVAQPDNFRPAGSWYRSYYKDGDVAAKAAVALGQEYAPQQTWLYEAAIDTVLLPEEARVKFGSSIALESQVKTLTSVKYRHEFHFISLPAAVAAYALMKGWIDYEFDLHELTERELSVTDELSAGLIGGEYYSIQNDARLTIPYTESALWKRRAELWAALGEPDPRVYLPTGEGKKAFQTTSPRLSEALHIASDWSSPVWARVAMIQDPRVDAVSQKSGNRLTHPALLCIFENEEEARAAGGPLEEGGGETPATSPSTPPVPTSWAGAEDAWMTQVRDLKGKVGSVPVPVARVKITQMMDEGLNIAATPDEVIAWWGLV